MSNENFSAEIRRRIADFKQNIDLEDLARWLGMEKPKASGNWRSPHRKDESPSVSIFVSKTGEPAWKDHTYNKGSGGNGSCIDLVMYVQNCDQWEAIKELHRYRGMDLPSSEQKERTQQSLEEFIAFKCLKEPAEALRYLTEVRKIPAATVEKSIKARMIGWNTYTSDKKAPGDVGYGGPGAAFIVRSTTDSQVVAVDMRYEDAALNGGVKTQTQGPKEGAVWLPLPWRTLRTAKTMYIVESPINALSVEACGMGWTHAIATRGVGALESIDWAFLAGMQVVICMDADEPNEKGHRPGIEAAWRLYDLLTARKIAAVIVNQSSWAEDGYNDCNDILQAGGVDELKKRLRQFEDYAIPGLPSALCAGPQRVFLPSYDHATYWRFRAQADFTDYVQERKVDKDGGEEKETLIRIPLAGFRVAALTKITVQSWQATCGGAEDLSPTRLFAASAQVPREKANLQRLVFRPTELHKPNKWQEFGPVFKPEHFQRLISILERTVDIGERKAANFVGVCWLDGKLIVSEGSDCFFEDPTKQCQYADLRFHRGAVPDAKKCIAAYAESFRDSAALLALVWIVAAPALKTILGFWPHFQMQAEKGAGKTTLLGGLGATTGFTMLSSQQAQTAYRVLCSVGHTSMPVGWEEVSTNDKKAISTAMSILQECYQFAPHTRGSDNLRLLNSAPVLLAGEDMHGAETLTGKLVRTSLTSTKQGAPIPGNLPPFPMRTWLEWITGQDPDYIRERYQKIHDYCIKNSSAKATDAGAKRMTKNYAAVMLGWAMLLEFTGLEDTQFTFRRDALAEMNRHILDTVSDREPFIWILEKLANEISKGRFEYPFKFEQVEPAPGEDLELCLIVRPSHVMDHMSTSVGLRDWFNALPVKSHRTFKQQLQSAGIIVKDDEAITVRDQRYFHLPALSLRAMEAKGVFFPVPKEPEPQPEPAGMSTGLYGDQRYVR